MTSLRALHSKSSFRAITSVDPLHPSLSSRAKRSAFFLRPVLSARVLSATVSRSRGISPRIQVHRTLCFLYLMSFLYVLYFLVTLSSATARIECNSVPSKFIAPGRANRAVSGVSMGGYGALHLAFHHPELFSAVSAHSPAIIDKLPAFTEATPAGGMRSRVFGGTFGSPPDPAFWNRNSPLLLARTANLAGLKIYFDCGDHDDFGFEAGAAALVKILSSRHIPHEAHIYPGRHDWQYFAEHLPASLEFHSHAFATK